MGARRSARDVPTQSHPPVGATGVTAKTDWRYRWYNGRWWYWTPQNRWMWYGDDGQWVTFDANSPPPPAPGYYPAQGYWAGYYPGVGVSTGPYGNVGVGVGQRIGVDVSGPHGGVRVDRIYVGW